MVDLSDGSVCPVLEEIGEQIRNPLFGQFCAQVKERYQCLEKIEYSGCSWEKGWNVKFKKAGKTLCTIYPREGYFTAMIVVGKREKDAVEAILPDCSKTIRDVYNRTKEGNGQRWLMIDLEDRGKTYEDLFRLMDIRRGQPKPADGKRLREKGAV